MKRAICLLLIVNALFPRVAYSLDRPVDSCSTVQEFYNFRNESITKVEKADELLLEVGFTSETEILDFENIRVIIPKLNKKMLKQIDDGLISIYTPDEKTIIRIYRVNLNKADYFSGSLKINSLERTMAAVVDPFDCKNQSVKLTNSYIRDMILFNQFLSRGLKKKDFTYYVKRHEIGILQVHRNYAKFFKRVFMEDNSIVYVDITKIKDDVSD